MSPPTGPRTSYARCGCCLLAFSYPANHVQPTWCVDCNEHFPGSQEPAERTIARLTDHEQRVPVGMRARRPGRPIAKLG
jgi:hypothetical protein